MCDLLTLILTDVQGILSQGLTLSIKDLHYIDPILVFPVVFHLKFLLQAFKYIFSVNVIVI